MEESYPMTSGNGRYSYTKNSIRQRVGADNVKTLVAAAIDESLDIEHASPSHDSFRIADLGCSVGPNTYISVKNIIEAVVQKYQSKGHSDLPEFQVFFNDHASNDFNILFANLPLERQYFAAGVPGSFHGRLFPNASLNFFYSAVALHWLSKAPPEVGDLNSPICNKGRIYYSNSSNEVVQAYSSQFAKDMESFFSARAQELAPGGLMAILFPGRDDGTLPAQSSFGLHFQPLESCVLDMVNEAIISEDKVDSFNLPIYGPSREEMRTLILQNGCFDILRLDVLRGVSRVVSTEECRAVLEGVLSTHFGNEIVDQLFDRYSKKIAGLSPINGEGNIGIGLVIMLKRER